jgi:Protein of unknown function (DUF4065)
MSFSFSLPKATEAACLLLEREGGAMNVLKLVKLVYLLDRLAIERVGVPVAGGTCFSMRNGPVNSALLDLINAGCLWGEKDDEWERHISDRRGHEVKLRRKPRVRHLSPFEVRLVDEIYKAHGHRDQWALVKWCHKHCKEWMPLDEGRTLIRLEEIGRAVGKTEKQRLRLKERAQADAQLERLFATA